LFFNLLHCIIKSSNQSNGRFRMRFNFPDPGQLDLQEARRLARVGSGLSGRDDPRHRAAQLGQIL